MEKLEEMSLVELSSEETHKTDGGIIVLAISLGLAGGAALGAGFAIGWAMYEH